MTYESLPVYSPSQINAIVRQILTEALPERLIVRGEIRDWKLHHSGHCYFLLKDQQAVLPAVMWANNFRTVRFRPADGMAVLATGYLDVYVAGGRYQLIVERLEPEGTGALQLAFQQMVAKLKAEGLFDPAKKRPLPRYPMRIGIVTSPSGAALHDICEGIQGRWPVARLLFFPVPVQGEGAAEQIARTIRWINQNKDRFALDLLIVGRGGGSLEDLWTFNEEVLARAIYDSQIPIISAVGHEIDVTVADLVADARASTPAKAGVVAVPDVREVLDQIGHYCSRLTNQMVSRLELAKAQFAAASASEVFTRPLTMIRSREQQIDELSVHLVDTLRSRVRRTVQVLDHYQVFVSRIEPHRLIGRCALAVSEARARASAAIASILAASRCQVEALAGRIQALDPRAVLARGYSITRNAGTGRIIRSIKDVELKDTILTELAGANIIESQVTAKYNQIRSVHGSDKQQGTG
ncbi:MAG: exodeoxyribonuclease VII large subunit [Sedimentisphaerales bacterium]|nr:exodeoxyribonuclease VII large subunit [Sedimentisphaerales bacterium]